jgi:hypothetical protein
MGLLDDVQGPMGPVVPDGTLEQIKGLPCPLENLNVYLLPSQYVAGFDSSKTADNTIEAILFAPDKRGAYETNVLKGFQ